jgi:hypothetical protein
MPDKKTVMRLADRNKNIAEAQSYVRAVIIFSSTCNGLDTYFLYVVIAQRMWCLYNEIIEFSR